MITSLRVDWMKGYANDPRWIVELDTADFWPDEDIPGWVNKGGIHTFELFDTVAYFYSDGKPTDGFAGRRMAGTFMDGTKFEYRGGWSSRAGCVNATRYPGDWIVDVSCGYRACAVRWVDVLDFWRAHPELDFGLAQVDCHGEKLLQPTRNGQVKNPDYAKVILHYSR